MTLDDEQLDYLLRNVEVPGDLKASLLEIPDRDVVTVEALPPSKSWSVLLGTVTALAASVVLCFSIAPMVPKDGGLIADSDEIAILLAEMQQNNESIDSILQLQQSNSRLELSTDPIFDSQETIASVLSLSWQASIDQGASLNSVRDELQDVVDRYPDTNGAIRAQRLLQLN